jgi:hypothetical protein
MLACFVIKLNEIDNELYYINIRILIKNSKLILSLYWTLHFIMVTLANNFFCVKYYINATS